MHTTYDRLYFSPHLDDAALSCGAQIAQQTAADQRVLIVTITAGDPPPDLVSTYAESLHARWALISEATAARRAEDLAACQLLGADALHWPVPDCIYRLDPFSKQPFYNSDPDIFGPVHPQELGLVNDLAAWMRALPPAGQIFAPLTLGHHVDHQLTRQAAELAFGDQLQYYEDYPYAQQPDALARVIAPGATEWVATPIQLTEADLAAKIAAILAFRSQLSTFWRDRAELEQQVRGYAATVGGERVWRKVQSS